ATEALAAERGLPMLLGMHVGADEKAAAVARHGLPDAPHVSAHVAQVADTREQAVKTLMEEMPRWLGPGLDGYVPVDDRPRPARDPVAYTRRMCELHPVGSPDDCAEALVTTVERTGVRRLALMVEAAGSRAATLENIARLGEEGLPMVRAAVPAEAGRAAGPAARPRRPGRAAPRRAPAPRRWRTSPAWARRSCPWSAPPSPQRRAGTPGRRPGRDGGGVPSRGSHGAARLRSSFRSRAGRRPGRGSAVAELGRLVEDLFAGGDEGAVGVGLPGREDGDTVAVLEREPHTEVALQRAAHGVARQDAQQLAAGLFVRRRGQVVGEIAAVHLEPGHQPADHVP